MLLDKLKSYSIVLASQSPRRKELLSGLGIDFTIHENTTEEVLPQHLTPCQTVEYLAKNKVDSIAPQYDLQKTIIIGGDTVVCRGNNIMGKPSDKRHAIEMLQQLSGEKHIVISGLCVLHKKRYLCNHDQTTVYFNPLTDEEIMYYIDFYHPFDKAGAYGIQEWIGYQAIERIEGSFYNVVGLPTHLLWKMLKEITDDD
ncbi:MAG: Maf family nucleotide pyrophosphatase [Bacteroidales bacterium]|jgi:septum formation protein|nr:Maf family nucleotide pyrophosphatase [Bacteroidales bacterium]